MSFSLDTTNEVIRYTTSRTVEQGEELHIFYGHKLWFTPVQTPTRRANAIDDIDDGWGGLQGVLDESNPFSVGNPKDMISEADLPFLRTKVIPEDENEDEEGSVKTGE